MDRTTILARMNEITAGELTDALMDEYETLEGQLNSLTRSEDIHKRNNLLNGAQRPGVQGGDARQEEDLKDPEYRAAFNHYLRTGIQNADLIQQRAQSVGTPSEGGFLAPDDFRMKLIERLVAYGGIAQNVEEITTSDGRELPWPVMADDTGNRGEIVAEGTPPVAGQDLIFSTERIGSYSYASVGANGDPLRVSYELLQDSLFDIEGMVSRRLGNRIARLQAEHWVTGTGVDQPLGISIGTGTLLNPAAATAGAFSYQSLLDFVHTVDPEYRPRSKWGFNDNTLKALRGLLDENGRPILKEANEGISGSPGGGSLLGYPVVIDQAFPDVNFTSEATNWGVFGDLEEGYLIRRVHAIELLVNPYSRMNERQIEYQAWARADGTQQNAWSYIRLTGNDGL